MVRTDLIIEPAQYASTPAFQLLEAAARGYVGVDHRWLHALVDHPERTLPDLVRFAAEDHRDDRLDLDAVLLDIFRFLRTPEALPFLIQLARRDPLHIGDELTEAFVELGTNSVEPLLALLNELDPSDPGDVPFVLASLHIHDPRILQVLISRLEREPWDGALILEMYGDPEAIPALQAALARLLPEDLRSREYIESAIRLLSLGPIRGTRASEPYDLWGQYNEEETPEFDALDEEDLFAMLDHGSAGLRAQVAASFHAELPLKVRARLLDLAKTDPDFKVRQNCWETLGEVSDEPEIRKAMLAVIASPEASLEEKSGATVALATHSDVAAVFNAIENLYHDSRTRAAALKAMGRSFDRRFAAYPPKHLEDPDPEIQAQAIWAVGYLNLSSEAPRLEAFLKHPRLRTPALFAYSLAVPGDTSRGRIQMLFNKVERVAGELDSDEQELVRLALDQRLMLHGHKPVFFTEETDEVEEETEPAIASKTGRNDPCPCGSGKKYKKCCGA
ncbi:MAG TPA: SEC-C metal-binding domain-containing protein [Bryobacteraceae bacterium]